MMSLLVHSASYQGREALILACDDGILDWLGNNLATLSRPGRASRKAFVMGNGKQVRSEQGVEIRFKPIEDPATSHVVQEGGRFTWYVSREVAGRLRDLVRDLAMSQTPGHQYLEDDDPWSPMLVLSKGEYEEDTLRLMSADGPVNSLAMTH
jgi:hypothetical protein